MSTAEFESGNGIVDLGADAVAGITESMTAGVPVGLGAYFLVLLAVALIAARSLMTPVRIGRHRASGRGRRSGRPRPRSQWMIDPAETTDDRPRRWANRLSV